jgi:hypothetical protein
MTPLDTNLGGESRLLLQFLNAAWVDTYEFRGHSIQFFYQIKHPKASSYQKKDIGIFREEYFAGPEKLW